MFDGTSCKEVDVGEAVIGFYWNSYQYNKVSMFDGQMFSPVSVPVVTSDYCKGRYNEFVDSGFNLVFCNGNGEEIILYNKIDEIIYTKGAPDTFFYLEDDYYALKVNKNSLIFDNTISKF